MFVHLLLHFQRAPDFLIISRPHQMDQIHPKMKDEQMSCRMPMKTPMNLMCPLPTQH